MINSIPFDLKRMTLIACLLWVTCQYLPAATTFRQPVCFTQQDAAGAVQHMSAHQTSSLRWTSENKLALAYWEGGEQTTPGTPSRVLLREWTNTGDWAPAVRVDTSTLGGRHPSLLERADGALMLAWHDHRHCTQAGNYIDNIEMYTDVRPLGGSFPGTDVRLSQTSALHSGDNGYVPKLLALSSGKILAGWYDFYWDANISEICVRLSDTQGDFGAAALPTRLTTSALRETGDSGQSFTFPSFAEDGTGLVHMTWVTGTSDLPSRLYYGQFNPATGLLVHSERLRAGVKGFGDPPKLIVDPSSGDLWMIWIDFGAPDDQKIYLQRRGSGAAAFDDPIMISNQAAVQKFPAAQFDGDGSLHLFCIKSTGGSDRSVHYLQVDPATGQTAQDVTLTEGLSAAWSLPALAQDDKGYIYAVWEELTGVDGGRLWFTTTRPEPTAARHAWEGYE